MRHTLEILVELEVDGIAVSGFPFRHVSSVDFVKPFVRQDFGDTGFTAPVTMPGQVQAFLVTADQDFAVRLGSASVNMADIYCSGFILVIGTAIAAAPLLTAHAANIVPAQLWGFVAGKA